MQASAARDEQLPIARVLADDVFHYRIGVPLAGTWREIFNSDALDYGGSGMGNLGTVTAEANASHGYPASAELTLPPLSTLYFRFDPS